jgi:hypothetical protein
MVTGCAVFEAWTEFLNMFYLKELQLQKLIYFTFLPESNKNILFSI